MSRLMEHAYAARFGAGPSIARPFAAIAMAGVFAVSLWAQSPPANVSVTPSSGSGWTQTFAYTSSSPLGYGNIQWMEMFVGPYLTGQNACFMAFWPGSRTVGLADNNGNQWPYTGVLGSSTILQNSQCQVNLAASSVVLSGNSVTVSVALAFTSGFTGAKQTWLQTGDNSGLMASWQQMGTWTVTSPQPPLNVSVSPSSGSGASGTFAYTSSSAAGYGNIQWMEMFVGPYLTGQNACFMAFWPGSRTVGLADNNGNQWPYTGVLGSSAILQNSQCQVNLAASSAVLSGNNVTVSVALTFTSGFAGAKQTWLQTGDNNGLMASWQQMGTWTVTAPAQTTVTIQTSPAGGQITVGGAAQATPYAWQCTSGSISVGVPSPQSGGSGTQYVYGSWSDGGAQSHSIGCPASSTTYTAYLNTQYYLTMGAGAGGSVGPANAWYNSGAGVGISAMPSAGYSFSGWAGSGSGSYSGTGQSANVTMYGPVSETASFAAAAQKTVTIQTNPAGLQITVGGTAQATPFTWQCTGGGSITVGAPSPQSGGTGVQYAYGSWSDAGAQSHSINCPASNTTYSANFSTQYYLTMTPGSNGTVGPASGWYSQGQSVPLSENPNGTYSFIQWTGAGPGSYSGTSQSPGVTMNGPITESASFAVTMGANTWLHVNLGFPPFSLYDTNHPAVSNHLPSTCPPNTSVRDCFYNRTNPGTPSILATMRSQGVSGIRVWVTFCDDGSRAFSNCGPQAVWNPGGDPVQQAWIQNVANFFQDVHDAGIQNVTITTGYSGGATVSVPKNQTVSPATPLGSTCSDSGGNCCLDTPDPMYFNPTEPFGLVATGDPIGSTQTTHSNQGYICAPVNNQNFLGWTNLFNVVNAILGAARGPLGANGQPPQQPLVNVNELEFGQQEINLVVSPALLRYIYDNSAVQTAPAWALQGGYVDILSAMRTLMTNNGFDPGAVTWSAAWTDAKHDQPGDNHELTNCLDAFGDYARLISVDEIAQAINGGWAGGGWFGVPDNTTGAGGLSCGGVLDGTVPQSPLYNTQPGVVDVHVYPQIAGDPNPADQTEIQAIAAIDYSDLTHFLALAGVQSAKVILGETYAGTIYTGYVDPGTPNQVLCWSAPTSAPASNVAGFKQSALASGYTVIFRAWMEMEDDTGQCFAYGDGPPSATNFQNVNYNWQGPYIPGNH